MDWSVFAERPTDLTVATRGSGHACPQQHGHHVLVSTANMNRRPVDLLGCFAIPCLLRQISWTLITRILFNDANLIRAVKRLCRCFNHFLKRSHRRRNTLVRSEHNKHDHHSSRDRQSRCQNREPASLMRHTFFRNIHRIRCKFCIDPLHHCVDSFGLSIVVAAADICQQAMNQQRFGNSLTRFT